jgi:Zn-dependent protease
MHFDPRWFLVVPVVLWSLVVHEWAHAWIAHLQGDDTARAQGRLTLDPRPHLDPMGSILLPLVLLATGAPVLFGWARPVPIDHAKLRDPRRGAVLVALAGPLSNTLLAIVFAGIARAIPESSAGVPLRAAAEAGVVWNCALAIFNLIPIPPLDGSWVLMHFLKLRHIIALHHFRLLGLALVLALVSLPPSRRLFEASLAAAVGSCLGLFGAPAPGVSR